MNEFTAQATEATGPIKFATVSSTSTGDTTIVAAVAGKKLRVLVWCLTIANSVTEAVKFRTASTDITGVINIGSTADSGMGGSANSGDVSGSFSPVGHFETDAAELLAINNAGGGDVTGYLVYQEVD